MTEQDTGYLQRKCEMQKHRANAAERELNLYREKLHSVEHLADLLDRDVFDSQKERDGAHMVSAAERDGRRRADARAQRWRSLAETLGDLVLSQMLRGPKGNPDEFRIHDALANLEIYTRAENGSTKTPESPASELGLK